MLIILRTTDICIGVYGVIHTTCPALWSRSHKFLGNVFDSRKEDMLPSSICGQENAPRSYLGACMMAAGVSNERNKPALLSAWPVD